MHFGVTHCICVNGCYSATLFDELKHILSGRSESPTLKLHAAVAQIYSETQCLLQQLHTKQSEMGSHKL